MSSHSNSTVGNANITQNDVRRQRLEELENAKFSMFHLKACLIAGVGFFTDAYDLFVIGIVSQMIGYVYFPDNKGQVPAGIMLGLTAAALIGTLLGQLTFGYLGDKYGRKRIYGSELCIILVATFASCFSASSHGGLAATSTLIMWRFILGFGIGGDYPSSAIITSEFANTQNRGAMIGAVFAMQGFGILAGSLVSLIVVVAMKNMINDDINNLDIAWRLVIGLGLVPGAVGVYFRLNMEETPHEVNNQNSVEEGTVDVSEKTTQVEAAPERITWSQFIKHYSKWANFKIILATSMCWFSLDVAFYGVNLNNGLILSAIGFAGDEHSTPYEVLYKSALGNFILALMGSVPGYWFTVALVDRMGRKTIQIMGFVILTVLYLIMGIWYHQILNASIVGFIVLYVLANFFQNFGPNATTFIIPGEIFASKYRSSSHGISSAMGKLGAVVAQAGFSQLKDIGGHGAFVDKLLIIFGCFMAIGLAFTFLLPETKQIPLTDLGRDDYHETRR
jgi:PHS family inorganic phosphate transporter-like MFS transporter